MMQKLFLTRWVVSFVFFLSSCGFSSSDNPCQNYMEKDKMVEIFTETLLLETHLSNQQAQSNLRDSAAYYYAGIFQKHNITAREFEKAFECYMLDSDLMNQLMEDVLNTLSIESSRLDAKKDTEDAELRPE